MYQVTEDLESTLRTAPELGGVIVVEAASAYPGQLVFQPFGNERAFYREHHLWVSRYLVLKELFALTSFVRHLESKGHTIIFGPSCRSILDDYRRWSEPLPPIAGVTLYPYQSFALRQALERDYYYFNFCAGGGKSHISALGALLAEPEVVFVFTLSKLKIDMLRRFRGAGFDAVINDGERRKREKVYREGHRAWVMNYEKAWVDEKFLVPLVAGRDALFIMDEASKIVTDGTQNKSRKAIDGLIRASGRARVWPMSASVVGGNPMRYRDVFSLDGHPRKNPLGSKQAFINTYADDVKVANVRTRTGGTFTVTNYEWNLEALQEVRHRVGAATMAVRKTDPGVVDQFRGMQTIPETVVPTDTERELIDIIIRRAGKAKGRGETLMPYYRLLRYVCNTPAALLHTEDPIGREIARDHPLLVRDVINTKLEMINDKLEEIREAQDKVLLFTHWTHLTLHLIRGHLTVPYVAHYGVGQSHRESQAAQDRFKRDPDITCFLTSDAGSHGLNMQCARYVIQYEPLYSYDDAMQRAARIDRADSHLDGLTNYVMVTEGSVEERIWNIQQQRRLISEAVQGTHEALSYSGGQGSEASNLNYLIFGESRSG